MRSCSGGKAVFLSRNLRMLPDHVSGSVTSASSRKPSNSSAQPRERVVSGGGSPGDEREGSQQEREQQESLMDTLERKLNEKAPPQRVNNITNSGIVANDQTQCKIIAANKKMLFIISKDNFLYKRDCLTKAKKVRDFN